MINNLKIAVLCNNGMALPAIQRLAAEGVLCGIATSDRDREIIYQCRIKAAEYGVPYYKIGRKNFVAELRAWLQETAPSVVFVMTFPWLIPADILAIPEKGFYNFHYGLLPEMRGADPIFESIRHRMAVAGLTIHKMDEGFDTGAIVAREQVEINPEITYGMLSARMAYAGERISGTLVQELKQGKELQQTEQDNSKARYWPKVDSNEVMVKWAEADAADIKALIKASNPVIKGVPAIINGWRMGIADVSEVNLQGDTSALTPGMIIAIDAQNGLLVYCRDGKALKLEVVHTAEGVFPGYKLAQWGIAPGMVFNGLYEQVSRS